MSYGTIAACTHDEAFRERVMACAAQELVVRGGDPNPVTIIDSLIWPVASASDVEAAYASALAAWNPDPGGDESVITDQMILSSVQAHWPSPADQ